MSPNPEFAKLPREESLRFGFAEGDEWMTHLRAASRSELSGSIGSYEVIEEVGRGGQGVVYRARQPGMQRDIAVKRMIAGSFASIATRRRFEREVEMASTLHHPGIVTVYSMEVVDDVPVLAMEWVDGRPVNDWARDSDVRRDPTRILRLFLRISDAVAHAHQRGVIHCDLKPSNIVVDRDDRPRILDFGLARFSDGERDDSVVSKGEGFVGTLGYASPEQIEGDRGALDVRTDVYSLGIVLYELLVGEKPHRGPRNRGLTARSGSHSGQGDPSRPTKETWPTRRTEEIVVPRDRVGDEELRMILHTATAIRREERYRSVAEFAGDLRRHLTGRPILAHPPGALYVLRKFVGRNRVVSALAGALLLTLVAFAMVSRAQAGRLADERDAEANARRAAEEAGAKTEAILRFLVDDLLLAVEPKELGADVSVGELLAVATEHAGERFVDQPALEARVRETLSQAYDRLGRFPEAVTQQRESVAALAAEFGPSSPEFIAGEFQLALYLAKTEEFVAAVEIFQRAIPNLWKVDPVPYNWISRAHREIGASFEATGEPERARREYEAGLALVEEHLPDQFDEWVEYSLGIARVDYLAGDLEAAKRRYQSCLDVQLSKWGKDHPKVANVMSHLADIDHARGDDGAARVKRREVLRIFEGTVGPDHPWVASALGDLASLLFRDEDLPAGEEMLRRAIVISDRSRGPQSLAAGVHRMRLGINLVRQTKFDAAAVELEPTLRLFESQTGVSSTPSLRTRKLLVRALTESGRSDDAILLARGHLAALEASAWASDPRERRQAYALLEQAARVAGLFEESIDACDRKLEIDLNDSNQSVAQKIVLLSEALEVYREHGTEEQVGRWEGALDRLKDESPDVAAEEEASAGG